MQLKWGVNQIIVNFRQTANSSLQVRGSMTYTPKRIGCPTCKHNNRTGSCTAFPDEIPFMYLAGTYAHTQVIEGQFGDYVYEWSSPDEIKAKVRKVIAQRERELSLQAEKQLTI